MASAGKPTTAKLNAVIKKNVRNVGKLRMGRSTAGWMMIVSSPLRVDVSYFSCFAHTFSKEEKRSSTDDKLTKRSADEIQEVKRSPKKKKGKHHPKPSYPDCGAPICFRAEKKRSSVDDELTKRSADEIQEVKRSPEDFEKTKRDPKKKKGKHHPKPSYPDCGAPICFVKRELLL